MKVMINVTRFLCDKVIGPTELGGGGGGAGERTGSSPPFHFSI